MSIGFGPAIIGYAKSHAAAMYIVIPNRRPKARMNIRDHNRWGQLDERILVKFETRNKLKLPSDYRTFLLAHHGGVPEPNFYWVVAGDWGSGIESLYGFGQDGYRLQEYLTGRESIGVANDLLVIGDDGCCSFLAIGVVGKRRNRVLYIDHEFEPDKPGREHVLASSFTEFLKKLRSPPAD